MAAIADYVTERFGLGPLNPSDRAVGRLWFHDSVRHEPYGAAYVRAADNTSRERSGGLVACALGNRAMNAQPVAIRVLDDTVQLFRSPHGATLRATLRLYNRSENVLYFRRECGPVLQRKVGDSWQTVWNNQVCLMTREATPRALAPGDSVSVFAGFFGSTEPNSGPSDDPRVGAGIYRFVLLQLGSRLDRSGTEIAALLTEDSRATEPFAVREVRRP